MEIGSEFHWSDDDLAPQDTGVLNDWTFLRSGRDCLRVIAMEQRSKRMTVLMPELCCQSMVDPFVQQGYEVVFYPLYEDLTADLSSIKRALQPTDILLSLSYFGQRTVSVTDAKILRREYPQIYLLLDCTQSLLPASEEQTVYDAVVSSIRKWVALPDGGALYEKKRTVRRCGRSPGFSRIHKQAMEEKAAYLKNPSEEKKRHFRMLLAQAVHLIDSDTALSVAASESVERMQRLDVSSLLSRRQKNCAVLMESLPRMEGLRPLLDLSADAAPLYVPIWADNRDSLQAALAQEGVYCPVIWPLPKECEAPHAVAVDIAAHMLALPCDQRYMPDDMESVVDVLRRCIT